MKPSEVTLLLQSVNGGSPEAYDQLMGMIYQELQRLAGGIMRGERAGHTLQPTALVNEAYLRLIQGEVQWENRAHFFGAAAQAMRRILVDYARKRASHKRGGDAERVTLEGLPLPLEHPETNILALDEALTELAESDVRLARIVELRYFVGCSIQETARLLNVSEATVKRDWTYARAWLFEYMSR